MKEPQMVSASSKQALKQRVYQALEELPPESFEELVDFLDFLKFKYERKPSGKVVALGGLWKDLEFDVSDEEIRELRREVTSQVLKKVQSNGISG